jgi:hypothetical protein
MFVDAECSPPEEDTMSERPLRSRLSLILFVVSLVLALLSVPPAPRAQAVSPDVVISQVYGGGGNSGATYTHDFIELFNRGTDPVSLDGWSVQYASATGTGNFGGTSTQITELPAITIDPGHYVLIQEGQGSGGTDPLPTPDVTDASPIAMAATSGKVALANTNTTLGCNGGSTPCSPEQLALIVDLIGYGGANFFEGSGPAPGLSNTTSASRVDGGCQDTDDNASDFTAGAPTPRNSTSPLNDCDAPPPPPPMCGDPVTHFIHDIQGNGPASPIVGTTVAVEAVVVGDFQNNATPDNGDLNGFHIQEEDAEVDADPATSEGIFVFASGAIDVAVGDHVRVHGTVAEFNGLTEITTVSALVVCSTGNALPTAATVALPVTSLGDFETFEGMSVVLPQTLVVSEYFNFDRFGEIVLTTDRQSTPTAVVEPGPDAIALAAEYALNRITLDDGRGSSNPDPAIHPNGGVFDLGNRFRGGDTVANVTGVMDFAFGIYRIQPTEGADYTAANPRPETPDDVGGSLSVASFNVLNYFTTLDNAGAICGPESDQGCRGADNAGEFTRQRDKIISAITDIEADVVGLIEIENHPGDVPTADLVSGLNDELGAGTYDYIATGAIGTDAIRMAFIYKPATVSPLGDHAVLDTSVDPRFLDDFNRPVLAQTFQDLSTGGILTVAVNHLKSKGSDCDDIGDPDLGDGAGNCNLTRTAAAEALVDWLATDPTGSGDDDFLIIGDLNSYDKEDPIDAIVAGGYTDLILGYVGEEAYSFVFDGQAGYLDHALAGADLFSEVTGATVWHINADEPDILDYDTSFKLPPQQALYEPNAYRSSDHDPVIVGLAVCDEIAPTVEVSVTPEVLWPPNHRYRHVTATVVAEDDFDEDPTVTLVSVTSNEPDDGIDDGHTINDIVVLDDFHFLLRAERSGLGEGRVYTITYSVTDDCGNETIGTATVTVPLNN